MQWKTWLLNSPNNAPFFIIAGPCVVEDEETPFIIAEKVKHWCEEWGIPYIFKASYRKANRTKLSSFTGIGDQKALEIIKKVGETYQIPTLTDIHETHEAAMAAEYVDILQIPAFLCRQTALLQAAGKTGKIVNIKKGQFMSGLTMRYAAEKVAATGNKKIFLTERGNFFGYNDLVVDFRNLFWMRQSGYPVVMDITHSVQQPNRAEGFSGGQPQFIALLGRAAAAVGVDGFFLETHPNPEEAKSDGPNMLPLEQFPSLLRQLYTIAKAYHELF